METIELKLKRDEERVVPIFWAGGTDQKIRLRAVLDQPGASLTILGALGGGSGSLQLQTEIIHIAPHTFSRTEIRGALEGDAALDYRGSITLEKGARGADADLKVHALLLSSMSRATALPSMFVRENDVKAGHGATVSRIEEAQIFYLMTRGLSERQSKSIITAGFLEELIARFPKPERQIANHSLGWSAFPQT